MTVQAEEEVECLILGREHYRKILGENVKLISFKATQIIFQNL